jgi:hypothetical protein
VLSAAEAVDHRLNSLDNCNANFWTDEDGTEWGIYFAANGIEFSFTDKDGNESVQRFALVETI